MLLQTELCPPKKNLYLMKPQSPVPQNVTVFGDRVFEEVIKLKRGH